jgi:large subunit ribosomal protein L30
MWAVIRIRGRVGLRKEIRDTLTMLRLHRKMHCVLLNETPDIAGMLFKVKDIVTWGEISDEILRELLKWKGRRPGNKRLTDAEAEAAFKGIKQGKRLPELGLKPVFRLVPPSRGFRRSIKQRWPKGEVGYRGGDINELLRRMI